MKVISEARAHRGVQGVYAHASVECACANLAADKVARLGIGTHT